MPGLGGFVDETAVVGTSGGLIGELNSGWAALGAGTSAASSSGTTAMSINALRNT